MRKILIAVTLAAMSSAAIADNNRDVQNGISIFRELRQTAAQQRMINLQARRQEHMEAMATRNLELRAQQQDFNQLYRLKSQQDEVDLRREQLRANRDNAYLHYQRQWSQQTPPAGQIQ